MASKIPGAYYTSGGRHFFRREDGAWYEATGPGQIRGLEALYGSPRDVPIHHIGPVKNTVAALYNATFGGTRALDQAVGVANLAAPPPERPNTQPAPPSVGDVPEPTPVEPVGEPRDFAREARAMFPWLPEPLLDIFVGSFEETENAQVALAEMRQSDEYKTYFPGNIDEHGRIRMSEADYFDYASEVRALFRDAGLPEGFYTTPEDIGNFVAGGVRLSELERRVNEGFLAAQFAPAEVREELQRVFGVGEGGLAAVFLDPDRAEAEIMRGFQQARIAGVSRQTGFGRLTLDEAERLAALGVTEAQARQGFSTLSQQAALFGRHGFRGEAIDRDTQLAAAFEGDAAALQTIERRRDQRLAVFQGGGGAALSARGVTGLGSSTN